VVTFSAECPIVIWQKPTLRWQKSVTYLEARADAERITPNSAWPERARSERKDGDQWVSLSLAAPKYQSLRFFTLFDYEQFWLNAFFLEHNISLTRSP
jgi:hypothetical protein